MSEFNGVFEAGALTMEDKFSVARFKQLSEELTIEEARELLGRLYETYLLQGRAYRSFIESNNFLGPRAY